MGRSGVVSSSLDLTTALVGDGLYEIGYTAVWHGTYSLNIAVCGIEIGPSPFKVPAIDRSNAPSNVRSNVQSND